MLKVNGRSVGTVRETDLVRKRKGITLVALVITIIVLLILAGVSIAMLVGQNGILVNSQKAIAKSENAQIEENATLADYENEISGHVSSNRNNVNTVSQPTGLKTDTYICNTRTVLTTYSAVTSMTGFTRTTDPNNKILEYLSYSDADGYTVLKSGWYYVRLNALVAHSSTAADLYLHCYLNNVIISTVRGWEQSTSDTSENSFSIFLAEGDKIYFSAVANGASNPQYRSATAYCYPMF